MAGASAPLPVLTPTLIRQAVVERAPPSAVRALVRGLAPIVQARVARILLRGGAGQGDVRQAVEDLTQDVFEALLADGGRRLLSWDPTRSSARTFFGVVAERLVLNRLATRKHHPWAELAVDPSALPPGAAEDGEHVFACRQRLQRLSEQVQADLSSRDQALFRLLYVEGAPVEQVMTQRSLSRDAFHQARRRLVLRLRALETDEAAETEEAPRER